MKKAAVLIGIFVLYICLSGNRCAFFYDSFEELSDYSQPDWRTYDGYSEHTASDGFVFAVSNAAEVVYKGIVSEWVQIGFHIHDGNGTSLGNDLGILLFEDGEFGDIEGDFSSALLVFEDINGDGLDDAYIKTADGHKIIYLRNRGDNTFHYFETDVNLSFLKGTWHLNGDPAQMHIVITDSGEYQILLPDGTVLSEGNITHPANYFVGTTYIFADKNGGEYGSFELASENTAMLSDGSKYILSENE